MGDKIHMKRWIWIAIGIGIVLLVALAAGYLLFFNNTTVKIISQEASWDAKNMTITGIVQNNDTKVRNVVIHYRCFYSTGVKFQDGFSKIISVDPYGGTSSFQVVCRNSRGNNSTYDLSFQRIE